MSDDEDDDWFESAFRDDDSDDGTETEVDDGTDADDGSSPFGDDTASSTELSDSDNPFADSDDGSDSPFDDDDGGDSPFDDDDGGDSPFDDDDGGGSSPFDDDGSDGSDSPFDDDGGEGSSPFDEDGEGSSPFDEDGEGSSPFDEDNDSGGSSPFDDDGGSGDGGGDDGGGSLFGDDFATAFESAGGGGGGADEEFEDEDFDSDIPRIDIGIEGLDRMIQGGIPRRHLIVTIGSAGTGKTTFGLQFLHHGLENGENCVFITLEQSYSAIMDTANDREWEFDKYEANDQLAVIDLDPVEMANSLDNIRGELPGLVEDFDADRLVLDSVSLLEMMYDDPAKRRTEVFDFTRSLKSAGVTTMLTSEASEDNAYASRHGIIEYLTDAVFILQYVRAETSETRLAVEIQKIRNANHSRETKPYEITMDGISVYQQANIF